MSALVGEILRALVGPRLSTDENTRKAVLTAAAAPPACSSARVGPGSGSAAGQEGSNEAPAAAGVTGEHGLAAA